MQEQQYFLPCLPCPIKKNRWKNSILQHNLCFYINIKRMMNPEGLQATTAKWQVAVKLNVSFSFQSNINSRLSMISFTVEQQTFVYWAWVFPVYLIYLLIVQADREMSFFVYWKFWRFQIISSQSKKEKAPRGTHLKRKRLRFRYLLWFPSETWFWVSYMPNQCLRKEHRQ